MAINRILIFAFLALFSCNNQSTQKTLSQDTTSAEPVAPAPAPVDENIRGMLDSKYYFTDGYHELTVDLKTKGDTCYVYYLNIVDNGNYLNSTDDSTDYAGKFNWREEVVDSSTALVIKNYRDEEDTYPLRLTFRPA